MHYQTAIVNLPLVNDGGRNQLIRSPADIHTICADLASCAQESFHALLLDAKNRLINRVMVSLGTVDASLVHPRETFREAIQCSASAVALAHSHPSGDPTPSAADLRVTRQLVEAGRIIDIRVLDHVVIGRDPAFVSLRESGLVSFK